jgi:hypothetical protein
MLNAKMAANQADQARMEAEMKVYRKADKEYMLPEMSASMKSNQDLLARLETRIETNRGKDREALKGMMEEMDAKVDGQEARGQ